MDAELATHGFAIRREQARDVAAVDQVVREAFGGPDEAELVSRLRCSDAYLPGCTLVAETDGVICGFAMATCGEVRGNTTKRIAVIAPVAVSTHQQRRGIGQALVRALLDALDRHGFGAISVLGDPDYYSRFGFRPALPLGLRPPTPAFATDAFQVYLPGEPIDLEGTLAYPTPFEL